MLRLLGLIFLLFLLSSQKVLAVTTKINNYPSSISADPFLITVSVSGSATLNTTDYLRIDLYKEGTQNYFGNTFNGVSWYGGSTGTSYFPINIVNGKWSDSLQGRAGNPKTSEYDGTGSYKLRVRRYTSSTNYSVSEANNSAVALAINLSTPTPSPTPTPTQSSSSSSAPIDSPSASPDSVLSDESSSDLTFTPNPTTISINLFDKASSSSRSVLPVSTKSSLPTPKSKKEEFLGQNEINPSKILMILGIVIILGSAGILAKSFIR